MNTRRERKVVTVLFADLVGFTSRAETMDPEDVEAILRPYHERLRAELERHGGTVEKFIGDAVMAVFGAPVAHEDDPERAVRAALAIRDRIVDDGQLSVRIGVNTGEALVNLDARPDAGEGMVSGDVVNTAARLQAAAPENGILVGESTYRATEQAIEYRGTGPVDAKGKSEPVPVWEAVQATARVAVELHARRSPLVGRARERELVVGAFERVREDESPQLVTIVGVPGIGKSRLVAELYGEREHDPALTHWRQGRSLPYGEALPYAAFAEMVKAQAGILESDGSDDASRKLHEAVAAVSEDPDWVESRLRPLVGLEASGSDRDESFAAWRRFVETLAEQRPTVLVFEDLHWADDDLLDFVDHLVDWATGVPLLVVATARPELLDRRPGWGGGKRNALMISLAPLADDETARLIALLLGRSVLPAETQQALLGRAGGNPLYAEQFARMLAERGDEGELPETVQGIIAARLDGLPQEEKALLQDAAVIGKVFWLSALETIAAVDRRDAEQRLHGLERKEFVRRERRASIAGETEHAFAHLLVRDVAYGQIPRKSRAEKHRLAAEWLESLAPDRSEDRAEMLAHHYLAAIELAQAASQDSSDVHEPARRALIEAAERATALHAPDRAVRRYSSALDLTPPDSPERARLLLERGRIGATPARDEEDLREAYAAFLELGDVAAAADAAQQLGSFLWFVQRADEALTQVNRALELVADAPPSLEKVRALEQSTRLSMLARDADRAIATGREGVEMARTLGLRAQEAGLLISLGTTRANSGDPGGTDDLEAGLRLALEMNSAYQVHRGINNLQETHRQFGEWPKASETTVEMRRLDERFGVASALHWTAGEEIIDRYFVGEWDELERSVVEFLGEGPHYLDAPAYMLRARVRAARGDRDQARSDFEAALERAPGANPEQRGAVAASYARFLFDEGRSEEASRLLDEMLEIPVVYSHVLEVSWLLVDLGRTEDFEPWAATAPPLPWLEVARQIVAGDFSAAADLLGEFGVPPEEAYARLRAAEQLASEGRTAEAAEQRDRALAFYRSVGASTYVRRAEALLPASA